jgi:hypothetical protein
MGDASVVDPAPAALKQLFRTLVSRVQASLKQTRHPIAVRCSLGTIPESSPYPVFYKVRGRRRFCLSECPEVAPHRGSVAGTNSRAGGRRRPASRPRILALLRGRRPTGFPQSTRIRVTVVHSMSDHVSADLMAEIERVTPAVEVDRVAIRNQAERWFAGGGPHPLDHFRGPDLCVLRAALA